MSGTDSSRAQPKRSRGRRVLRVLGWVLLGLVALVGVLVVFLHSAAGQRFLTERVRAALAQRVEGSVQLSSVEAKLFGRLALRGVVLADPAGKPVVELDELVVAPSWRDLLGGRIVVERIELSGLRLAIEQHPDGSSNLKKLFKPRPAAPSEPKAKKSRRIVVRAIDIHDVGLTLQKPDGSKLAVREIGLKASVDAIASDKTVSLDVTELGLSLQRTSADGTRLGVAQLKTGLAAHLVEGAGTVKLSPLSARLSLERPGRPAYTTPLALSGIELNVKPGELSAMLGKLEAGLVLLESLEVRGGYAEDALHGEQRVTLLGLSAQAKQVNLLLGKELLREDVHLLAKIAGPPEKLDVELKVDSAGTRLSLAGKVDLTRFDRPRFDLELVGTSIETKKLLASPTAPDVAIERLVLKLNGEGIKRDQIATDIRLELAKTRIRRVVLDGARLRGRFERGVLTIHELVIDGLDQKIRAEGSYALASKEIDAKLTITGDVGVALARLKRAGVPIKTALPPGSVRFAPGELNVEAKGRIDQDVHVRLPNAQLRVAGGRATIDAKLELKKGKLETIDADVRLSRVDLGTLAKMRGKRLRGMDGKVDGRISVQGTKQAPRIDGRLSLDARADDAPAGVRVEVVAKGDRGSQHLSVIAVRKGAGERERLLELEADVPLRLDGRPRLERGRKLSVKLSLPRRRVKELSELLPRDLRDRLRRLPPDTELAAEVDLHGTSDAPRGSWRVTANAPLLEGFSDARQAVELSGRIEPEGRKSHVSSSLSVWADAAKQPTARADVDARFAESPLVTGGKGEVDWKLALDVPKQRIEQLPLLAGRGLSGEVGARFDLSGTRRDVRGRVALDVKDFHRGELGPLAVALRADVKDNRSEVDLKVGAAGFEALRAQGQIGVAGTDLITKLREKKLGDPTLDLNVELPKNSLARWSKLRPKLAGLAGSVGGKIHVGGSVKEPLADGKITADGFAMQGGKPGRADLTLSAGKEQINVELGLGPEREKTPLTLSASAPRSELVELLRSKQGERKVDLVVRARADASLGQIVPKLTPKLASVRASGKLDWNMDGKLSLESRDGKRSLGDAELLGRLALTRGEVPIPGTERRYRDVELSITSSRDALSIDKLALRESDRENKARRLNAKGKIGWKNLKPERVKLSLDADDWLLFGGDLLGKPDAPRAALTAKLDVDGALSERGRTIDVLVKKLDLRMPDRFDKAHWSEQTSIGDVMVLGEPGVRVGKLVRPPPVAKPNLAPPDPSKPTTVIHVKIPKPIHVQKPPFDMVAQGALDVRIVQGEPKPRVSGELVVLDGHMDLGGRDHRISKKKKSRILFDAAHPSGELDLYLTLRPDSPSVLRDMSKASAGGDDVRIHLAGPIAKPVSTVTGVGNADMWDILPVHNAGRVKFTSQPDMPASSSPQVPREYDVVLLSYMAANLPHNLFLDRINAWSDPYDDRTAYGKIRHLEAERYSKDGKTRVRVNSRPPTMGQSDAEVEAGYLMLNGARTKAGVGVVGGTRAGGGPVLFFDWSSED